MRAGTGLHSHARPQRLYVDACEIILLYLPLSVLNALQEEVCQLLLCEI